MAYKADMEKAFDQMEWDLIVLALENFGFPPIFIKCIYSCLSSASFSILLNGSGFGNFHASRGLRQGDPLSPFLYIIGSEILSRLLLRDENRGNLEGIKLGSLGPSFSHLLFADDILIFGKATIHKARVIHRCLSLYFLWFEQSINQSKFFILFSKNTPSTTCRDIKSILNLQTSLFR